MLYVRYHERDFQLSRRFGGGGGVIAQTNLPVINHPCSTHKTKKKDCNCYKPRAPETSY